VAPKNRNSSAQEDLNHIAAEKIRDLLKSKEILSTRLVKISEELKLSHNRILYLKNDYEELARHNSDLESQLAERQQTLLNKDQQLSAAITYVPFEVKLGILLIQAFPDKIRYTMRLVVAFVVAFRKSN